MRHLRMVLALGAFFVSTAVLTACGSGGVSGDSLATVGDKAITKKEFNHWLVVAAKGAGSQTGGSTVVPEPPKFTRCVNQLAKANAKNKATKATPKKSLAAYRGICRQQYQQYRDQTMNFLIQASWVEGEAKDQGISVTQKDVQKSFEKQKKQAFPKEKQFASFLKNSGMTRADVLFRVRIDLLANKLRDKANKNVKKVTQADVKAYYDKHKAQFGTPESRDIRIVLAKKKSTAAQALKALRSGQSFKVVAKKYSIDGRTKNSGGLLTDVSKGQEEAVLEKAAFAAKKGELVGPVKAPFGWYVLRVEKVKPGTQDSLQKSSASIRQQLIAQRQQNALQSFVKTFRKKWTDQTDCRDGYKVEGCKGFKPPKQPQQSPQPQPQPQPGTPTSP